MAYMLMSVETEAMYHHALRELMDCSIRFMKLINKIFKIVWFIDCYINCYIDCYIDCYIIDCYIVRFIVCFIVWFIDCFVESCCSREPNGINFAYCGASCQKRFFT